MPDTPSRQPARAMTQEARQTHFSGSFWSVSNKTIFATHSDHPQRPAQLSGGFASKLGHRNERVSHMFSVEELFAFDKGGFIVTLAALMNA